MNKSYFKQLAKKVFKFNCIFTLTTMAMSGVSYAEEMPGKGIEVKPIFPPIAEERFRGEVAMAGLTELGYEVQEPKETQYATMMLALSYGDADFTVHVWDKLHNAFYQKVGGDKVLTKVGNIIPGVSQGYLIDKKTADKYHITKLNDLKKPEIAKLFDNDGDGKADLTGCNPGWGCELVIDHHLKAYDLEKTVTHHRGSYFALMADTITRYKQGESILYFTWVPQWISSVLVVNKDVVWLEVDKTDLPSGDKTANTIIDGKNLGFEVDEIKAVLNRNFADKNPAAVKFLSLLRIPANDESAQNLKMQSGEKSAKDIKRHAQEWITANRSKFDAWLTQARNAK